MNLFRFITFFCIFVLTIFFISCTIPPRTGYDRKIGGYKLTCTQKENNLQNNIENSPTEIKEEPKPQNNYKRTSANSVKASAIEKSKPKNERTKGNIESYASKWIGAKYVYGAATVTKTDCSGFVMQVYKGFYNIQLDHSASSMYKDSRGTKISRGSLKEGDLIFFGSFWKIDHVGIYLNGDRFIHASTSKGVIISPMNDKYWSHKYQGGRRFK